MKAESILPFNWRTELENFECYTIDDDFILVDKPVIASTFQYPFRMDVTACFFCISGISEGSINLKPYTANSPCMTTFLPGHIVEIKSISDNFSGLFIIMSSKFTDSLMENASERLPLFLSVRDNPVIPLDEETLKRLIEYFETLKRLAQAIDHPYRLEVVRYLTLAFLYGSSLDFYKVSNNRKMMHKEKLVENFLNLVSIHHKRQRELKFYAPKMNITPRHLSKVIKETSGRPANDWIDDHVILEAKALLKSTDMTIQQISDELNFPSQSFFGKYFKRVTGITPSEYKGKG
jgi:AraC-like DNA-binding protein